MAVRSVFDNPYYTQQTSEPTGGENKPQGGGNWAGAVSALGQGVFSGASGEEDRFSIDPNAGFTGSFQGLGSGGVVGAIAGGIGSQIGTFSRVNKNLKNLRVGFDGYTQDDMGNVSYNANAFVDAQRTAKELEEGQRKINRSIDPATRVFSGIFGTKKKLRKAQRAQESAILGQQNRFNQANIQSNYTNLNRRSYEDQLKNVYGIPMNYY